MYKKLIIILNNKKGFKINFDTSDIYNEQEGKKLFKYSLVTFVDF